MGKIMAVVYGFVVYGFFLATLAFAIGFVGNLAVPKSIDSGPPAPFADGRHRRHLASGVFAVQHSVMARRSFKRWWTRFVQNGRAQHLCAVRESSRWASCSGNGGRSSRWSARRESAGRVGRCTPCSGSAGPRARSALSCIDHFDLFGLRQVVARLRGQRFRAVFRTPLLYRHVRHPIYLGFVLAFWAAPQMTAGHLLFAAACTGYILIGIWFEERDLIAQFGQRYALYRKEVGMLVPKIGTRDRKGPVRP